MTALIFHNDRLAVETNPAWVEKRIALVFCKPLLDGKMSVEHTERVKRLVRAIQDEDYRPHAVCFLGSGCENALDCFRKLMPDNNMLRDMKFLLEPSLVADGAVQKVVQRLQRESLRRVLQNERRRRLHIKFALVSSDYHLCVLNDIHVRSPGQSCLQALQGWATGSDINAHSSLTPLLLESSWTYLYAHTTRLMYSNEPAQVFIASCYRRAQSLLPVLQNLRGVVRNTEFFQRENYRVLVQVRRTFVADVERLYRKQPSLQQVHKILTPYHSMPLDVVLEFTVVSLGRCSDLVRPSGLLTGSVPIRDFELALSILERTINQLAVACDQDRPHHPEDTTNDENTQEEEVDVPKTSL